MEEGCTVAITCGAHEDATNSPRCSVTRKPRPRSAWAAVAPRQTITEGFSRAISASSQGLQAAISAAPGFLWMRRLPRGCADEPQLGSPDL